MSDAQPAVAAGLDEETTAFYRDALQSLTRANVPFLVGGAYALERYTGLVRHTKDLDVFLREKDLGAAMETLRGRGYRTEDSFPHWLSKAYSGSAFVDLIFSSGNGLTAVDDTWFEHSEASELWGVPARLIPAEEMIWSKAFLMERERFDGADVAHLILARSQRLDWARLLARFGPYWRVLLSQLVMFGFVYPSERQRVPAGLMQELLGRLQQELRQPPPARRVCQGTLVSRAQYLVDVERMGFEDVRLQPSVKMTPDDISRWTDAIEEEGVGRPR